MTSQGDEDLVATKTDGFKVGEKKTVEEYAKLGKLNFQPISCIIAADQNGQSSSYVEPDSQRITPCRSVSSTVIFVL